MTDNEAVETYQAMVSILHDMELDWISEQIAAVIREGKIGTKQATILREDKSVSQNELFEPHRFLPSGKEEFKFSDVFTPQERLMLLLDGLEQGVVDTAAMEVEIINTLNSMDERESAIDTSRQVEFRSIQDQPSNPLVITRESANSRNESAMKLRELLEALRKEV